MMMNKQIQQGFTLIELMVVIVILTIFAGMMSLSVGSSDSRKNLAFYEHLQSNLTYIRLLSVEQMQPYGLAIKLSQGKEPSQIVVVKLENAYQYQQDKKNNHQKNAMELSVNIQNNAEKTQATWQIDSQIPPLDIPTDVEIDINPLETTTNYYNQPLPKWFVGNQAPPVIWFGTGEATPVRINVQKRNMDNQKYLIGDAIIINASGAIEVAN